MNENQKEQIILASSSPRRRELLSQIGISFTVKVSDADEHTSEKDPGKLVEILSERKAEAVFHTLSASEQANALVIGADTVVALDGEILGKPTDEADAFRMLAMLQGRSHQVYTGVTILCADDSGVKSVNQFFEETTVTFYPMTEEEIRFYIATREPMDKAGAYGIQGKGAAYVKEIHGDYNNVVGLPIARLYQELRKMNHLRIIWH